MEKVLRLKEFINNTEKPFPSEESPIIIGDFTYSAKRMDGIPTISASIMYNLCLDDLWHENVYVCFNGEKYYLKQTPTSSKNNTDSRYKHELEFVSERIILDNVYFYDTVSNEVADKPVSNSSTFSFFGKIDEFANRLRESLKLSGIDYEVVVDDGISSEGKLLTFSDAFFSNALQEAYKVFNIPYYFNDKEIHFGYTNNIPDEVFRYGFNDALLSINKTNRNQKIVNRITGVGSSDNIPYYYPNDTPKGDIDVNALPTNKHLSKDDFKIKTPEITARELLFSDKVTFEVSGIKSPLEITKSFLQDDGEYHHEDEYNTNTIRNTHTYIDGWYHHTGHVGVKLDVIAQSEGEGIVECALYLNELSPEKAVKNLEIVILENNGVDEYSYEPEITDNPLKKTFNIKLGDVKAGRKFEILIDYDITRYDHLSNDDAWYADFQAISDVSNEVITRWRVNNHKIVTLKELGIELNNNDLILNPQKYQGEGFFIEQIKYIQPQLALMPSIYRDTLGKERFLNALNGTYVQENSNAYYEFKHPYIEGRPKEHIQNFEDIKPSITNMVNSAGQRMDMFLDFAYDDDDNDEVDENGEYLHPYFFAKLPKFDGEYGFNLFDQAIEEEEMAISMTSGSCGACHWIIAVGEDTQKNVVQVDDNGNLLRGANGNVLRSGAPQERQNDTRNNEVWIALRKDIETFGVSMPSSKLKPTTNDTFVILHINMPKSYVLAAEDRLQKMLIQYMAENNSERFDFSISFSRIYFAENPEVLALINENARLTIEYNGEKHLLYISSYQYKMKGEEHLPEIIVELSDELTVSQNAIQNAVSEVKNEMLYRLGNIDWLAIGQKYFLRKDSTSDTSNAKTNFQKEVTFGSDTITTKKAKIQPTGDAHFNNIDAKDVSVNNVKAKGDATFGEYSTGLTGNGAKIDRQGRSEMRSLRLWESLEVPEIRYNRISINIGFDFDSVGGGIIESVTPDYDENGNILNTGTCTLKLEDGEAGAIALGDLCMGMWHDEGDKDGNATEDSDDRKGSFTRKGFKTVYFHITEIDEESTNNGTFKYTLRSEGGNGFHPYPQMHFAQRGNITNKERQAFRYSTTEYTISLCNVDSWTFDSSNIYEIRGKLDGFTMLATNDNGEVYAKTFTGYGQVFGNAYMYGTIDQFDKFNVNLKIIQSLNGELAEGEKQTITIGVYANEKDLTNEYNFVVTRSDGTKIAEINGDNPTFTLSYSQLASEHEIFTVVGTHKNNETIIDGVFVVDKLILQEQYMGFWDSTITYMRTRRTYPTVTHLGSKWYLVVSSDKGTEPLSNSNVWGLMQGSEEMEITFSNSSNFVVLLKNVNTIITLHVMLGFNDITKQILSQPTTILNWSRNSGDTAGDYSWQPTIPDLTTGGVIENPTTLEKRNLWLRHDSNHSDLGLKWRTTRTCMFTAQIILPNGDTHEADIEVSL